ncbi:MAG: hypothetical protein IKI75_09965 [Lachnospiraceae bacterium]|nr:hypothetical protein [Lachnospiraceae bacterium]
MENRATLLNADRQLAAEREKEQRLEKDRITSSELLDESFQSGTQSIESAGINAERISMLLEDMETTEELKLSETGLQRLHQIRLKGATTLLLGLTGSDSPEMKEIKSYARRLDQYMEGNRKKMMTEEVFDELDLNLQLVSASCEAYINNRRKRENRRKRAVREYYASLRYQIDRLKLLRQKAEDEAANGGKYDLSVNCELETWLGMDKKAAEINNARRRSAESIKKGSMTASLSMADMVGPLAGLKEVVSDSISKELQPVVDVFDDNFKFSESVKGLKPKYKREQLKKAMGLMNELRGIESGTVKVLNITLMGVKVRLLQRGDNSLSLLDGEKEIRLGCSIPTLLERMEMDVLRNQELYGYEAADALMARIDLTGLKEGSADSAVKRQQICEYIRERTGLQVATLDNVPTETLLEAVKFYILAPQEDPKVEMQRLIKTFDEQSKAYDNSGKALSSLNYYAQLDEAAKEKKNGFFGNLFSGFKSFFGMEEKEKKDEVVRMPEKYDRWSKEVNPEKVKDWNYGEEKVVNLFADMISDSQSFTSDNAKSEQLSPGEMLRRRMGRHMDALKLILHGELIETDVNGRKVRVDLVDNLIDRMPFPAVKTAAGRPLRNT